MNRSSCCVLTPLFAILCSCAGLAQVDVQSPLIQRTTPGQPQSKNTLTVEELNALDAKFHKELDTAQDAFDRETFADAEQGFAQLRQEIEETIKKIAVSTMPKNSFIEMGGVKTPVTIQTETELFTRILDKAKRRKDASAALHNVTDLQKQAMTLLNAHKYPDDLEAYRKSLVALIQNRALLDDSTFQFFSSRSENGQKESSSEYWAAKFKGLKDKYNRTTEEPKMSTEEIRSTIKAVADEIATQDYTDAVKFPDMPDYARVLFGTLATAANQYLAAQ